MTVGKRLRLLGVDGCRAGWVVATSDLVDAGGPPLSMPTFSIARTFADLLSALAGVRALVAVDMPIGLASGAPHDDARRRVDGAARAFLGRRRASSVFSAPCRPTLGAATYREACELEVGARGSGLGLSQQSYRIISKIREVDAAIQPDHQKPIGMGADVRVREVHPEVTFAVLAGAGQPGHGMAHSKRRCTACRGAACPGESDRLLLLRPFVSDFEPRTVQARLVRDYRGEARRGGAVVGCDDVVDAVACLVSAYRIATGQALTLPYDGPQLDARGLRMEIVA